MAGPTTWFVSAALVGLGQHRAADASAPFTAAALASWVAAFSDAKHALLGIQALVVHRYLEAVEPETTTGRARPVLRWRLTHAGAIAARETLISVKALPILAYGPLTPPGEADRFGLRLWNLLRIRKMLTADEAACSLIDAGEDVARARRKAGEFLLGWSRQCPYAVRLSAKRVDGAKRYVLAVDIGIAPPDLRRRAARRGAAR